MNEVSVSRGSNAFLVTAPAPPGARRRALAGAIALFIVFCALVPFARIPLPRIEAFDPIFESTLALINLVGTSFLLVAFRRSRLRAVLCLASGYFFTTLMVIPLMLASPGVLSGSRLLSADPQTSAWLDTFRNAGLPLFVICYALLRRYDAASGRSYIGTRAAVIWTGAGVVAGICLLTLLASAGHQLFPRLMVDDRYAGAVVAVNVLVCLVCLAAVVVLVSRPPYSILDLWLMVVVLAWMFGVALSTVLNAGHFDIGFFAGRLYGLLAAGLVPIILIVEASRLYGRLDQALAVAGERNTELARSREELAQAQRLEAIGQLTGGIAHDFNNLLTVVLSNLDLILRARGDTEKIERLAQAAMKAAQRGELLVRQLLTYARRQITHPDTVNLNQLIVNIESLMHRVIGEQIEVVTMLSPVLFPAQIDPTQFETAMLNLVLNSRDAMAAGGRITIETRNVTLDREYAADNPS